MAAADPCVGEGQCCSHRHLVGMANELSAVKVEDNPAHVAAALLVLDIAPDIVATSPS